MTSEIDKLKHFHIENYSDGTRRKSKRINKMVYGYLWC